MTFKEKIDKIVRVNTLEIHSPSGLEKYIGAGVGSITKYIRNNEEPGEDTIKKILDLPGLNKEWWETGKGDVFIKNNTSVHNEAAIKEKPLSVEPPLYQELYEKFVGANSKYIVIHKDLLEGHRIVALEQFEKDRKQMEKDAKQLDDLLKHIETLEGIIDKMTTRLINVSLPGPQEAKENRTV